MLLPRWLPVEDPLLLHGGIGPFQQGKLCPPCVDLQLQYLEQARLLLLEEKLMKSDEAE